VTVDASGRDDEDENEDNRGGHQTKAEEAVFARGHIAFCHSLPRIQGMIIVPAGVAKITQSKNLRMTAPERGRVPTEPIPAPRAASNRAAGAIRRYVPNRRS
jgi:hypothetical protein